MKYYKYLILLSGLLFLQSLSGQVLPKDIPITQKEDINKTDTIINNIHKIQYQNNLLNNEIEEQSNKIEKQIEKKEETQFSYLKDFIFPIILSIIAAIIFWLAFSFLPERTRRKKIRPKLDLDMFNVYTNLFSIFDLIMRPNKHSPSYFQQKIKGNKLEKEDIELGLQDKCLNETYLYDNNVSKILQVIGKSLYHIASKIDLTVERLFNFSNYLTAEEILLLEKIRKKLQVYELSDYNRNAASIIGGMEFKPVNPTISYMSQNLFELYKLFIQFQDIVYGNNYSDRDTSINKVQHYYYSGQYNKCKNEIKNTITKYPNDKNFLEFYLFLSEYLSDQKENAYKMLENILKEKPHLVSSRGFLNDVLQDKKVTSLITKYFTEKEIIELYAVLNNEELLNKSYIDQAKRLLKYYKDKTDNTTTKTKSK